MYRQNVTKNSKRLKIFTWHVHGGYLYYLTQADCEFYVPYDAARSSGYGGKVSADPLEDNVHEVPVEKVKDLDLDAILFQNRRHYEEDQYRIFSKAQLRLPKLYVEHDPPGANPTDTLHVVKDPSVTLVHVTNFNRLM